MLKLRSFIPALVAGLSLVLSPAGTIGFAPPCAEAVAAQPASAGPAWARSYGGSANEYVDSLVATADDNDVWLLKLDAGGNVLWQKTYGGSGGDWPESLIATADGGYAIAGWTYSFGVYSSDVWVLKLDAGGNVLWQKTYAGGLWDYAFSLTATADGGYVVAGSTESFGEGYPLFDAWVLKLDAGGNVLWQKTFGGSWSDSALSVVATGDGGYVTAGNTSSFGADSGDVWVLKLDAGGHVLWQKNYGGSSGDSAQSLIATADGGYAIAGYTESFGAGAYDAWVLKLDTGGNVLWQKTYGGSSLDWAYSLIATADGGYAVAGETFSFGTGDAWVLKLRPDGSIGANCDLVGVSDATVTVSTATPEHTSAVGVSSDGIVTDSEAEIGDTNAIVETQCLYQPPLHVAAITPGYRPQGNRYLVWVRIRIADESGRPVPGAEVHFTVTAPNGREFSGQFTTNARGEVQDSYVTRLTGEYTICVDSVTKAGWLYDESQNVETCDSVTIP